MKPLKHSFVSILRKLGSFLNTAKRESAALKDAEKLKKKIEAGYKRNTADNQTETSLPIAWAIKKIVEDILNKQRANQKAQRHENKINRVIAVAAVIVATIYAGIAAFQWCEMIKSNNQARAAFEATERAYVTPGRQDGKIAEFVGAKPLIKIYFYNTGRTTASMFMIADIASTMFQGPMLSQERHPTHSRRYRSPQGGLVFMRPNNSSDIPGGSVHAEYIAQPSSPSREQFIDVKNGKHILSLYVVFDYCDEFGGFHSERYQIRYDPPPIDDFYAFGIGPNPNVSPMTTEPDDIAAQLKIPLTPLPRCRQPNEQYKNNQ